MAGKAELLKAMDDIDKKMQAVEYQLITRADALSDDKYFQTADKLYLNLIWLNGEIGTGAGDVAGTADYGATETAVGLVLGLEKELQNVQAQYRSVMEKDVPAYNRAIAAQRPEAVEDRRRSSSACPRRRPLRRLIAHGKNSGTSGAAKLAKATGNGETDDRS